MPQADSQPPRIFICYRRRDSAGYARALFERLARHFGDDQIFMDLDQIEPGEDFVQVIEDAVGSCEVLLALIGPGWLASSDEPERSLDNPHNYVRLEIVTALARGVRVIPVLVQGAQMPNPQDLPEDLRPLSRRHAHELSNQRWNHDIDRLIRTLERAFEKRRAARLEAEETEDARSPEATHARSDIPTDRQKSIELAQTLFVIFLMFVAVSAAIALRYLTDEHSREVAAEKLSEKHQENPAPAALEATTEPRPPQDSPGARLAQGTPEPSATPPPSVTPAPATATPTPFLLHVRVRADSTANGWTDSGLMVRKGQQLRITATGRVNIGGGRFSTPEGLRLLRDETKPMSVEPTGALIALIGEDNHEFIHVGAHREFYAPRAGRLFLGINEGKLDDNRGTFDVLIEVFFT